MNSTPIYKNTYGKEVLSKNHNGKFHGYCIHVIGGNEWKGNWINGKMTGKWEINIVIHSQGSYDIKLIGNYKNSKRVGIWFKYSDENDPYFIMCRKSYYIP